MSANFIDDSVIEKVGSFIGAVIFRKLSENYPVASTYVGVGGGYYIELQHPFLIPLMSGVL